MKITKSKISNLKITKPQISNLKITQASILNIKITKNQRKIYKIFSTLSLAFLALISSSCSKNKIVSTLEKEQLFELNYGNFEDELNIFDLKNVSFINTSLAMKDGFFYIANGESKKIMEMNSYGDLLTLFYNEETNPPPSFVNALETSSATRKAVSYPFNEISKICVDSQKKLYVVEKLPSERQEFDENKKVLLSNVVLRFDENSNFVDYLGQEGSSGTPFPYIKNIYANNKGELIVVCLVGTGYEVFIFSQEGFLKYKIPIEKNNVPNPIQDSLQESFYSVDAIIPDNNLHFLYLKVDYFTNYVDESSRVQSGIDYIASYIYPLDAETGVYSDPLLIPPYQEELAEGLSKTEYNIPYDFIGCTDNNWFFFMVSSEDGLNIQMVQGDGSRILNRKLELNHSESLFYTFNLDNSGIISVLTVKKDKADVSWWRTDSLIQAVIKN